MLAKAGWTVERSFTLGIGLDELLVRPEASPKPHVPKSSSELPQVNEGENGDILFATLSWCRYRRELGGYRIP